MNSKSFVQNFGFTLIEILIVLSILGGLVMFGMPRLFRNDNNVKKILRKLGVLSKEMKNKARLQSVTYRLVIEFAEDEDSPYRYWVEVATGKHVVDGNIETSSLSEEEKSQSPFKATDEFFKDIQTLPPELKWSQVESPAYPEPIDSGLAYIHFFPEGLVEESIIMLQKGDKIWSLYFHPLTGTMEIINEDVSLEDVKEI